MAEARPGDVAGGEAQRRYKNLEVGCRVSGSFGEYRSNPNPNIRRRVRARLYGNIVCALDRNRYKVAWDNGTTSDCYSNCLSKEASFASLPPDVQLPLAEDRPDLPPQGQEAADNEAEAIVDNERDLEEEEHLPDAGGAADSSDSESEEGVEGQVDAEQPSGRVDDPEGRMPGQLPSEAPQPTDYLNKKAQAVAHVDSLLGQTVTTKHKGSTLVWTVIKSWDPESDYPDPTRSNNNKQRLGLKSFDPTEYKKDEVLAALFLHLAFDDWKLIVKRMNAAVDLHNNNKSKKR